MNMIVPFLIMNTVWLMETQFTKLYLSAWSPRVYQMLGSVYRVER